jgi:hypothetical protein
MMPEYEMEPEFRILIMFKDGYKEQRQGVVSGKIGASVT